MMVHKKLIKQLRDRFPLITYHTKTVIFTTKKMYIINYNEIIYHKNIKVKLNNQ